MKDIAQEFLNLQMSRLRSTESNLDHFSAQNSIAIILIVLFFGLSTAASFARLGVFLNYAVPLISFLLAIYLYFKTPHLYISFMFWCWFAIPLIRRIADFYTVYTNPSPMLLSPYLVSLVSVITLVRYMLKTRNPKNMPFILASFGVIYAILIGFINRQPYIVLRESMDWIIPVSIGYHLLNNWRQYHNYRRTIQSTFVWSVFLMGIYGIIQFLAIPDWDRLWVIESGMIGASGTPDESGGTRVWSTMQSGEPFAAYMAAALLVMMTAKSYIALPASIPGYISFLLSMVRSGWLGWLGGLVVLGSSLKVRFQIRLLLLFTILLIVVLPLSTSDVFGDKVTTRLETLSNVQEDSSATGRQEHFRDVIGEALLNVVGNGIGGGTQDNIILAVLFDLGWIGAIPYISGLALLIYKVFVQKDNSNDLFIPTCKAVVVTALVRLPVNGSLLGLSGITLWGFLALALAGNRYNQYVNECSLNDEIQQSLMSD